VEEHGVRAGGGGGGGGSHRGKGERVLGGLVRRAGWERSIERGKRRGPGVGGVVCCAGGGCKYTAFIFAGTALN
jgi:hypothetical protein